MTPITLKRSLEEYEPEDCDDALDLLFDTVDRWLCSSQFEVVDAFLTEIEVERWPEDLLIGVLSITFPARGKLQARQDYLERVGKCMDHSVLHGL